MSNNIKTSDFEKSSVIEKIYNPDLMKGAKAFHKYLRKDDEGKYIYHESYQSGAGAKAHHHKMMEDHHRQKASFHNQKLSTALDATKEGILSNEDMDYHFDQAKLHSRKVAEHKSKRIANAMNLNDKEKGDYEQLSGDHERQGITPEKYAQVFEAHETEKAEKEKSEKELGAKVEKIKSEITSPTGNYYRHKDSTNTTRVSNKNESKHNFAIRIAHKVKEPNQVDLKSNEGSKLMSSFLKHENKK